MFTFICSGYNCSSKNLAEKLFREDFSEERDGDTYGAMIQGLVKVTEVRECGWEGVCLR